MAGTHYRETLISCLCSTLRLPTGSQLLSVYLGLGRRLKISAALGGAAGSHTQPDPHPEAHAYPFSRRVSGWALRKRLSFPKKNIFRTSSGLGCWPAGCLLSLALVALSARGQLLLPRGHLPSGSLAWGCCQPPPRPGLPGAQSALGWVQLLLSPRPALLGVPRSSLAASEATEGGRRGPLMRVPTRCRESSGEEPWEGRGWGRQAIVPVFLGWPPRVVSPARPAPPPPQGCPSPPLTPHSSESFPKHSFSPLPGP